MIRIFDVSKKNGHSAEELNSFVFGAARNHAIEDYEQAVRPIIESVRKDGDEALYSYSRQFDSLGDRPLRIKAEELSKAAMAMSPANSVTPRQTAVANIRQFARSADAARVFRRVFAGPQAGLDRSSA